MYDASIVRGILEQAATELAAPYLKAYIASLREEVEAIRRAAQARDLDDYARHILAFHRIIVEASGNSVLLRVWDSLMLEVRTRITLTQLTLALPEVAELHVPIVQALVRGDGKEGGRLLREHAEMFFWSEKAARVKEVEPETQSS